MRDRWGEFDLGLAPLVDTKFNRLKSDIKVLEYTALCLPVVASATGPYQNLDIVKCATPGDWRSALGRLIGEPGVLEEAKRRAAEAEIDLWETRRSSLAGETMVSQALSL
jgi:hypothetical protein